MLLVKTRLGPSQIEGIGLFADQDIPAGTVTWRFDPRFDQVFPPEALDGLPEVSRAQLLNYAYVHGPTGHLVFCLDNARFMNHADEPNTMGVHAAGEIAGHDIATRDIRNGEEITCDYRAFDGAFDAKLKGAP